MIKDRVIQIAEFKGIKKEVFFTRIGVTSANFRGKARSTPLNSSTIENILSEFPDINSEWLITGKGNISKLVETKQIHSTNGDTLVVKLYDISEVKSLKTFFLDENKAAIGDLQIPNFPTCDGAIHIIGDGMYPLLNSGDIVAYKELQNPNNIIYGEMYLLSINIEGDEYVSIKYINKSEKADYYKLTSFNPNYDPKDIPISSIEAIAIIKMSIRQNTML